MADTNNSLFQIINRSVPVIVSPIKLLVQRFALNCCGCQSTAVLTIHVLKTFNFQFAASQDCFTITGEINVKLY